MTWRCRELDAAMQQTDCKCFNSFVTEFDRKLLDGRESGSDCASTELNEW